MSRMMIYLAVFSLLFVGGCGKDEKEEAGTTPASGQQVTQNNTPGANTPAANGAPGGHGQPGTTPQTNPANTNTVQAPSGHAQVSTNNSPEMAPSTTPGAPSGHAQTGTTPGYDAGETTPGAPSSHVQAGTAPSNAEGHAQTGTTPGYESGETTPGAPSGHAQTGTAPGNAEGHAQTGTTPGYDAGETTPGAPSGHAQTGTAPNSEMPEAGMPPGAPAGHVQAGTAPSTMPEPGNPSEPGTTPGRTDIPRQPGETPSAPGEGRDGGANNISKFDAGTPELPVQKVVLQVAAGKQDGLKEVISSQATGKMAQLRNGTMTSAALNALKKDMEQVRLQGVSSSSAGKTVKLLSSTGKILQFEVRKEGDGYKVKSLYVKTATRRRP